MTEALIVFFDLIGTIAFAISGALIGISKKMDLFGTLVLAITTACGGGCLRDMIVGSVHSTVYVDLIYWLKKTGDAGWLSMDQYPYRENAVDAIAESIEWVRRFEAIVDDHFDEIDRLVKLNDAVATSRFMRKALFG